MASAEITECLAEVVDEEAPLTPLVAVGLVLVVELLFGYEL